jgi:hypothetical protein
MQYEPGDCYINRQELHTGPPKQQPVKVIAHGQREWKIEVGFDEM